MAKEVASQEPRALQTRDRRRERVLASWRVRVHMPMRYKLNGESRQSAAPSCLDHRQGETVA